MTLFRVWAPAHDLVHLVLGPDEQPMQSAAGGWHEIDRPELGAGTDYGFRLSDGEGGRAPQVRPDPRTRWQPAGILGPSRVVDDADFAWTDQGWTGRPLAGSVIYELHVGTFTEAGTFDAAALHLDHLVDLGVDLVELLPVAAFDGTHGWGYDGVAWHAVQDSYGGPDGLKRLVDACHAVGLGVLMDVVYNHLGPSGNVLPEFGPYFTDAHSTPWGPAVNYDEPGSNEVRRFALDAALMWLRDYHCDGLRLDAVHAVADARALPLFEQLGLEVAALSAELARPLSLVAESDLNDPKVIRPSPGGWGMHGQWLDDAHHAVWTTVSGERQGYYRDFGSLPTLAKAIGKAFVHDGTWSSFRGRDHGRPVDTTTTSGHQFVTYLSNHDQVGNRAVGDRPGATLTTGRLKGAAALVLLGPFTPMVFQGEEWDASTPFQFFTSFPDPALGDAVRTGRRAEFASHGWAPGDVPDPQDPATRLASVLRWDEVDEPRHTAVLDWYRALIRLRRAEPDLHDGRLDMLFCGWQGGPQADEGRGWFAVRRGSVLVAVNFSGEAVVVPFGSEGRGELLLAAGDEAVVEGGVQLPVDGVAVVRVT